MASSGWNSRVIIDAAGDGECHVRPRSWPDGSHRHLFVRAGPIAVFCLDATSVADLAAAWAAASVRSEGLPARYRARPAATLLPPGFAYPISEVVAEGAQRWHVQGPRPGHPFLTVTTGWLSVRIRDHAALDSQTRTWAEASAWGARIFRDGPPSFNEALRIARTELADQQFDRALGPRTRRRDSGANRDRDRDH